MAKLLREYCALEYDNKVISETVHKNQPIVISAIMQRAEAVNQNGRIYPKALLEREILNYQKLVNENRALGECDHPDGATVSLKNVSHVVREIGWRGDDVVGKLEVLNTPSGLILRSLLESGIRLGISSRGVGDVIRNESGNDVVEDNFQLCAFDLVADPSTHGAFLGESKTVNLQEVFNNLSKRDRVNRIVNSILKS